MPIQHRSQGWVDHFNSRDRSMISGPVFYLAKDHEGLTDCINHLLRYHTLVLNTKARFIRGGYHAEITHNPGDSRIKPLVISNVPVPRDFSEGSLADFLENGGLPLIQAAFGTKDDKQAIYQRLGSESSIMLPVLGSRQEGEEAGLKIYGQHGRGISFGYCSPNERLNQSIGLPLNGKGRNIY